MLLLSHELKYISTRGDVELLSNYHTRVYQEEIRICKTVYMKDSDDFALPPTAIDTLISDGWSYEWMYDVN